MSTSSPKIRVAIVDDEPLARAGVRDVVRKVNSLKVCGEAADGESAVRLLLKERPDIVLLDIQMPEMNGFDVLQALPKKEFPVVIFVTAYDRYAIKAFSAYALDYVLKPIDPGRLQQSLQRGIELVHMRRKAEHTESLSRMLASIPERKEFLQRMIVKEKGKYRIIPIDNVLMISSYGDYVRIATSRSTHLLRATLQSIEKKLDPEQFARIHRSTILRIDEIEELISTDHGDFIAILRSGAKMNISRRYKENLPHRS